MNVKELKALAKERGIKRYYRLRKAELIEILDIQPPPTDAPTTIMPVTEIMEELKLWKKKLWKRLYLKLWKRLKIMDSN